MKLNRNGAGNVMAFLFLITVILLIGCLIFALWAYSGRQKYKNNVSSLISSAVQRAQTAQQATDQQKFNAQQQSALATYNGPSDYGSLVLQYPKIWSSFINVAGSSGSSSYPLDAYFLPNYLSSVTDDGSTNFALRVQIESQPYSQILQQFDQGSGITVNPYSLPKVPNDVGVEISGQIANNVTGTMIVLPLRSQALEVWTEGNSYLSQFNNIILPNLSFSP